MRYRRKRDELDFFLNNAQNEGAHLLPKRSNERVLTIYWNTNFHFEMVSINYILVIKTFITVLIPLVYSPNLFYYIFELIFPLNVLMFGVCDVFLKRYYFFKVLKPLKDFFGLKFEDRSNEEKTNIRNRLGYWKLQESGFKVQPVIVSGSEILLYTLYFSEISVTLLLFFIYQNWYQDIWLFWSSLIISVIIEMYFCIILLLEVRNWVQKLIKAMEELKAKLKVDDYKKVADDGFVMENLDELMSTFVEKHNRVDL